MVLVCKIRKEMRVHVVGIGEERRRVRLGVGGMEGSKHESREKKDNYDKKWGGRGGIGGKEMEERGGRQQEGRERRVVRWRKEKGRKWKDNKAC